MTMDSKDYATSFGGSPDRYLAIDPGCSGGFAWHDSDNNAQCCPMPDTEGDVLEKLREIRASGVQSVIMEDQVGYFGQKSMVPASAMFKLGKGFGFTLGCSQALGFSVRLVRPQSWQKALSLGSKKDSGGNTPWKNKLKSMAQRLYPSCTVTLKTADALLLLHYASK